MKTVFVLGIVAMLLAGASYKPEHKTSTSLLSQSVDQAIEHMLTQGRAKYPLE